MKRTQSWVVFVTVAVVVALPSRAEAYLDPATGSMILQTVIGGVLAIAAVTKLYWRRIRGFFQRGGAGTRSGRAL